jgi:acetylornithine/N-succinyldiaminopimelate aminotransferase
MAEPRVAPMPVRAETGGGAPSAAVMGTYARQNLVFARGEGSWLYTETGDAYLDFASGVAVNALGHAHPKLVAALTEQAGKLWHTSNLYRVAGQEALAERLVEVTFADKVFFCNSGAEACEGAIKTARRYHFVNGHPERWRIITFEGAFHGRTLATIAAGGNPKYLEGFGEPAGGFDQVPFGDLDAVQDMISDDTAAIMVEPVQGEGGVRSAPDGFLQALRVLCDEHGLLLIMDEVQSGVGRTGKLFAHEWSGITPDIMAIAKGIGGGFPVGAFLTTAEAAKGMTPGTHGSTFGGNPLATAVGAAVLETVLEPGFLDTVIVRANRLAQGLAQLKDEFPGIVLDVRGKGLLAGVKLAPPVADVVKAAIGQKLLAVGAGENVLRILPPLNVSDADIAEGLTRLRRAFASLSAKS